MLVDTGVFVIPVAEFVFFILDAFEIHHNVVMSILNINSNMPPFKRSYPFNVFKIPTSLFDLAKHRFIGFGYFLSNLIDLNYLDFPRINEDKPQDQ